MKKFIMIFNILFFSTIIVSLQAKDLEKMVIIPSGKNIMGGKLYEGSYSTPIHEISLNSFCIDKYEVTQSEYVELMGNNPSATKERLNSTEKFKNNKTFKPTEPLALVGDKYPVTGISWYEAVKYCNKRSKKEGLQPCYNLETWKCDFTKNGYRLPTEAEWEYACRAGSKTKYYFGDDDKKILEYANYWLDCISYYKMFFNARLEEKDFVWNKPFPILMQVGKKKPNKWGLYDMLGNASEWCNDWFSKDYYKNSPKKNPIGPNNGHKKVVRGSSFKSIGASADRSATEPSKIFETIGFRCVRNAPKEDKDDKNDNKKEKSEKSDKEEAPE